MKKGTVPYDTVLDILSLPPWESQLHIFAETSELEKIAVDGKRDSGIRHEDFNQNAQWLYRKGNNFTNIEYSGICMGLNMRNGRYKNIFVYINLTNNMLTVTW